MEASRIKAQADKLARLEHQTSRHWQYNRIRCAIYAEIEAKKKCGGTTLY